MASARQSFFQVAHQRPCRFVRNYNAGNNSALAGDFDPGVQPEFAVDRVNVYAGRKYVLHDQWFGNRWLAVVFGHYGSFNVEGRAA